MCASLSPSLTNDCASFLCTVVVHTYCIFLRGPIFQSALYSSPFSLLSFHATHPTRLRLTQWRDPTRLGAASAQPPEAWLQRARPSSAAAAAPPDVVAGSRLGWQHSYLQIGRGSLGPSRRGEATPPLHDELPMATAPQCCEPPLVACLSLTVMASLLRGGGELDQCAEPVPRRWRAWLAWRGRLGATSMPLRDGLYSIRQ